MEKRLLIIEENPQLVDSLTQYFTHDYIVDSSLDGLSGIIKALQIKPDVIILSFSISKISSLEVCQQIRAFSDSPILIIGDLMSEEDRIRCFEAGTEDVIQKPFNMRELHLRMNVHLNKVSHQAIVKDEIINVLKFGDLSINKLTHKVYIGAEELVLTRKEFAILWMLVKNNNEVVTRKDLIRVVWGYDHLDDDRMIDTHLNRIRKKLQKYSQAITITTIWGVGYKIEKRNVFVLPNVSNADQIDNN